MAEMRRPSTWRRRAGALLRLLFGGALLLWIAHRWQLSLHDVAAQVARLPASVALGALALDLGGQSLCAVRWWWVGRAVSSEARLLRYWALYHAGMFFNVCLPTSFGGDLVRGLALEDSVEGRARAFASVLVDRLVGLVALLLMGTWAAVTTGSWLELQGRWPLWMVYGAIGLGGLGACALLYRGTVRRVTPAHLRSRIRRFEGALHAHLAPGRRRALAAALVLSVIYQGSEAALVWWLGQGLGVRWSYSLAALIVTLQALAGLLPVTVNGLGLRELVLSSVLMAGHNDAHETVRAEQALALSWAWFAVIVLSGLWGGLVALLCTVRSSGGFSKVTRMFVSFVTPVRNGADDRPC